MDEFFEYIYIIPAALIAIVFHEVSHGLVSYWLGDPTPKETGRLSLNPAKHLDPLGTICLIFFHFGWAKPVMVNPNYYKNHKWGMTLVALAGPLANFILAFISSFFMFVFMILYYKTGTTIFEILLNLFLYICIINLGLGLFNLIPIPPLDGSKIIGCVLSDKSYYQYMKYQRYSTFFLLGLLLLFNIIESTGMPSPLNYAVNFVYNLFISLWSNVYTMFNI